MDKENDYKYEPSFEKACKFNTYKFFPFLSYFYFRNEYFNIYKKISKKAGFEIL